MRSLRTRLLTGIIGGIILLLTIFSLLIYVVIRSALVEQFDTTLASIAQVLAGSVEIDGNEVEMEFGVQQMPEFQNTEHPTHYQLWKADGTVVAKSPLLGTHDLFRLEGILDEPVFGNSQDNNGKPQRVVCLNFVPRIADNDNEDDGQPTNEQVLTLVVALDAGDLLGQLHFLRGLLLIASAAIITLSFLIAVVVVRKGLRPLNFIAAEIETISADSLTSRIGAEQVPTEVVPIKNRLNELLSRLQASFGRERQFNADVAHELRTPLAGIRSTIEVTLRRHRDNDEYKRVLSDCQAIVENMQTMVNSLLMLTRLDSQQIGLKTEQIRLAELMNSCWRSLCNKAHERKIVFDNRIPVEMSCQSDSEHLCMVFMNIMDNAVEYADKGGKIWATARQTDGSLELAVSNTGCQLTKEQISQVFDCFWRSDSSRSDTGNHCGLGLALVQRLVTVLGGNAEAELEPDGIFIVKLILPSSR